MDQQDAPEHLIEPRPLGAALLVCILLAGLAFLIASYAAMGWVFLRLLRFSLVLLRAAWTAS